jgi:hypothetical protein
MRQTDLKAVINSVQVEKVDGLYRVSVDMPDKVIIGPDNCNDAMLLSEYLAGAARECDQHNLFDKITDTIMKGKKQ